MKKSWVVGGVKYDNIEKAIREAQKAAFKSPGVIVVIYEAIDAYLTTHTSSQVEIEK